MNAIICKYCGDLLVSRHTHDFKMCKCGSVGVDGGDSYIRRIGEYGDWIEVDDAIILLDNLKKLLVNLCNKEDGNATSMEDSRQ